MATFVFLGVDFLKEAGFVLEPRTQSISHPSSENLISPLCSQTFSYPVFLFKDTDVPVKLVF